MKVEKLVPNDNHKSFYGKACVYIRDDGTRVLRSYKTDVAAILPDGTFRRLWEGYSFTTMRHVNAFAAAYGVDGGGKKWWDALPLDTPVPLHHVAG